MLDAWMWISFIGQDKYRPRQIEREREMYAVTCQLGFVFVTSSSLLYNEFSHISSWKLNFSKCGGVDNNHLLPLHSRSWVFRAFVISLFPSRSTFCSLQPEYFIPSLFPRLFAISLALASAWFSPQPIRIVFCVGMKLEPEWKRERSSPNQSHCFPSWMKTEERKNGSLHLLFIICVNGQNASLFH